MKLLTDTDLKDINTFMCWLFGHKHPDKIETTAWNLYRGKCPRCRTMVCGPMGNNALDYWEKDWTKG